MQLDGSSRGGSFQIKLRPKYRKLALAVTLHGGGGAVGLLRPLPTLQRFVTVPSSEEEATRTSLQRSEGVSSPHR